MNSMLTETEMNVKQILEEDFLPALELELKTGKNYRLVLSYYTFNYCRQSSITLVPILEKLLPDFKWEVWEAVWECNLKSIDSNRNRARFDHSWVFGFNKEVNRKLIIDLTLDELNDAYGKEKGLHSNYQSFRVVHDNSFPLDMDDYENISVIEKREINIPKSLEEKEFYTELKGINLLKKVCRRMKNKALLNDIIYSN